jgi:hypothetical protein
MSTKTRQRPHLEVMPPAAPGACCAAARERAEVALLHFEIGVRTHCSGLRVDWEHVAYRMAQTLDGVDEEGRR